MTSRSKVVVGRPVNTGLIQPAIVTCDTFRLALLGICTDPAPSKLNACPATPGTNVVAPWTVPFRPANGSLAFPSPCHRLTPVGSPWTATPSPVFPLMTLPAPATVPPIVLAATPETNTPTPLGSAPVPPAWVPIRLPWTVFPVVPVPAVPAMYTPAFGLPEIRLPTPAAVPPTVL